MRSLLRSYWYLTAYLKKHVRLISLAVILGVILFAFILPVLTSLPQVKPTKYIGITGSYDFSSLPDTVTGFISSGLTLIDERGMPQPHVVERWSVEDEGRTYRFILREGIRWQDGKELVPQDIQWKFEDVQIIYTQDEIVFKLKEPFSPFPVLLSRPLFREVRASTFRFFTQKKIIGIGEYRVSRIKYQDNRIQELILDSSDQRIIFRFYITEDRAKTAFAHGEIDEIVAITDASYFSSWPNVQVIPEINSNEYLAVFFNHDDPLFTKNVRQALAYIISKPEDESRARGPLNPKSWAYLESVKSYAFDEARAIERLLDEPPAQPMNFSLTTTARFLGDAEQIKTSWESLGTKAEQSCRVSTQVKDKKLCDNLKIKVTLQVSNFPDLSNYQTLLIGQRIPSDPDQYGLWHSTQSTNFSRYKSPRIDALLENGRKSSDINERKAIYQEFQQFLLEDSPAIFLRHLQEFSILRR